VICSMSKKILVANLKDNLQIKQYFEGAGFWGLKIYKNVSPGPACRNCSCDAMLEDVSFISAGTKIQLSSDFENFSNFQPLKGMHYNKNITNNQCLCNEDGTNNIEQLEESLSNSDLGLWGHQFFESDVTEDGTLYVKAKMSWQEKSPVDQHRSRLNSIKHLILSQNAETSKQARIFFKNLFMTNVIGGYNISQSCSDPTGCYATGNYLTPSGIAVKLPDDATNFIFASSDNPDGVFEGALIGMTDASGPLRAYHYNSGSFAGYYNDLNGELKSGFETILTPTHVNNIKSNFPVENNGDCKVIIKETELITTEEINFGGIGEKNAEIDPIYVVVSSQFRNADNKTVSFLSGNAKIISLPFKQLQDIKYVYDAGIGDVENVSSGLLWSFELVDELCNVENYIFDNVSSYKYKTKVYLDNTNEISVDKFVYLMNCNGEYLHYPIKKGSLQRHDNLGINYTNDFDALTGFFIPFSSQNPLNTWTYSTGKISDNCTFCPNDEFSQIIIKENYCEEPEHIFVEKIAQIATAYPSNFRDPINDNENCNYAFAQKRNWELSDDYQIQSPSGNSTFTVPGTLWPWHNYLKNNQDIRSKFETDNVMFFQRMIAVLKSVKTLQKDWWIDISNKTPQEIICHLRNEDQSITSSVTWDNKKTALNTLFVDNSLSSDEMQCVIHLFASSLHEPTKPIEYLQEKGITIEELDEMFSQPPLFAEDEKSRLFFTLSALAKAIGVIEYPQIINNYLEGENYKNIIRIESDILNNNNVVVDLWGDVIYLTPGQNLNATTYWAYNELVPVIMEATITIDGEQFVQDKNTPLLLPAIQVVALAKTAKKAEFQKKAWAALDLGLMFVGVGEWRAAWAIANGWKKAYIFGEIVGGGLGLTAQLINSTYISDEMRMKMQLAGLILSAPNIVSNLANLFKTTDEMVEARRALPPGQGAIASQLDNVTDNYLKKLITQHLDNGSSFSQYSDEILDIVSDGCNLQCKVGKYGCFAGDTKVSTLHGSKKISTLDVDDDVLVYDTKSKTNITEKVKSLKKYLVSGLLGLVLSSGDTIMTTENHPLWSDGEMKPAIMLQKGDNLTAADGTTLSVSETFYKSGETEVYDLELNKGSNYYVSSAAIMTTPSDFCVYLNSRPALVARIDALPPGLKGKLMQDLGDMTDPAVRNSLMDFLDSNPNGVDAWKILASLPNNKRWVRINQELLEKMTMLDIIDQNKVNLFYTTFRPEIFNPIPPGWIDGVYFNKFGFPDFTAHAPHMPDGSRSTFTNTDHPDGFLSGSSTDMTAANTWAANRYGINNFEKLSNGQCKIKIGNNWVLHTWHHHEDGLTMFPVPHSIHSSVQHTGGASVIDKILEGFFNGPIF